jgi:glutamate/tyrosine decarboxylase-like PLP-dependent enzyme
MSAYPYKDRFPVNRGLPEQGRPREEILAEMASLAHEEDASWEGGRVSGTMYCGDHDHYDFLNDVFGLYAHVNILQRDITPSATRYEGEVIAMALDLFHADAVTDGEPAGLVTSGGTGSICHAVLAYREVARERGVTRPNFIKPETGHPAFDKACHLFGVELRQAPVDPVTLQADVAWIKDNIDDQTIGFMGSACNYGYGTIDPIAEMSDLAIEKGVPLHVDGCLGGFILPFGEELGYDVPPFDFRVPGVTSISLDTHKYGYSFKGSSTLVFRDRDYRNAQYFHLVGWSGGKYMSPGVEGSRSGGLLAATWAAMVQLGRRGYLDHARAVFATAETMKAAVRSHPTLRIIGSPTFCFSFTSDDFDIYHVADFMRPLGWRFNGQQYPNAIHMAVTGPQTRPGVVDAFATDLAAGVEYAVLQHADGKAPFLGALYGGVAGGLTSEAEEFVVAVMDEMLDTQQSLPPVPKQG